MRWNLAAKRSAVRYQCSIQHWKSPKDSLMFLVCFWTNQYPWALANQLGCESGIRDSKLSTLLGRPGRFSLVFLISVTSCSIPICHWVIAAKGSCSHNQRPPVLLHDLSTTDVLQTTQKALLFECFEDWDIESVQGTFQHTISNDWPFSFFLYSIQLI